MSRPSTEPLLRVRDRGKLDPHGGRTHGRRTIDPHRGRNQEKTFSDPPNLTAIPPRGPITMKENRRCLHQNLEEELHGLESSQDHVIKESIA